MLKQARLDTLVTTRSTLTTRRTCRDEPSGLWAEPRSFVAELRSRHAQPVMHP